jgi:hypothetical protein
VPGREACARLAAWRWRVLADAIAAGVVHANDDERLDRAVRDQPIRRLRNAPVVARVRASRIEQVLAVVENQARQVIAARRRVASWIADARGEIDGDVAIMLEPH